MSDDGQPDLTLPDGQRVQGAGPRTDSVLSAWLGRPVTLAPAEAAPGANAEYFADATDDTSPAIEWTMPAGRFVDNMPLLVLTTASLRAGTALHPAGDWDTRRFRSNVLVDIDTDGWLEDGWCGRPLHIGRVTIGAAPTLYPLHDGHPPTARPRTRPRHLQGPQPTPRRHPRRVDASPHTRHGSRRRPCRRLVDYDSSPRSRPG